MERQVAWNENRGKRAFACGITKRCKYDICESSKYSMLSTCYPKTKNNNNNK